MESRRIESLEELLDAIAAAEDGDGDKVSLKRILTMVGVRSFGPLLVFTGVVTLSPLGGVPGLPSIMAVLVLLVAVQLLFHRRHFWLPGWVTRREVPKDKLDVALKWSRPPARWIDRLLKSRLTFFTHNGGAHVMAACCVIVAVGMPPMEFVPFSATIAGLTLLLFGLALIAHDGLVALLGILFAIGSYGFLINKLF